MIRRNLKEIEQMIKNSKLNKEYEDIIINGVSTDSRNICPGQLFVPIKGDKFNGHNFILDAIKGGATAALWNKNEPIPTDINIPLILVEDTLTAIQDLARSYASQLGMKIVGITGSNGKTSTKDLLAGILSTKYKTGKTMGNLNNHLGVPLTILSFEEDIEIAVIEMGISEFGEADLLSSIANPDVAIITNIGEAHLETLYTRENIAKAKLEIIN
ncbi:UDP-N-acetylmuramoyl-tripeptide--D-alanyl-D-alanine ligase, partial [Anaerosalibacter bizertensis]|nr:UDP-N-acetylmuramoyl-tripeptide--D-alanyl-D-alanine ligase [Anaerosalibacter bizertensis]